MFDHHKYAATPAIHRPHRNWPNNIISAAPRWCAVDLRDGNQALIKPMTVSQKLKLFQLLVDCGFKEIEVGFPAASQPDFDFVRLLIDGQHIPDDVTIQVLTQARPELIARSYDSLLGVKRAIVHVYNSTSRTQREKVFKTDVEGVKRLAIDGARCVAGHAQRHPETEWIFQYSPESFTGTELSVAADVVNAVIDVWQPKSGQAVIINLPATVEVSTPNVFADSVEWMIEHMAQREHVTVSLHTHNDRGCGVAAAELGVMAGADRVEGTLLGNGERTGNMDLVTMAMNLYSQGIDPKLDFSDMRRITQTVEEVTEIKTHPRHAYAGELVFTAFSGSHQDAIRKCWIEQNALPEGATWDVAYLPIDPRDIGRQYEEVVRINSQSGKGGVLHVLEQHFGITLPRWLQIAFSKVVQAEAERRETELSARDIHHLFAQHYGASSAQAQIQDYQVRHQDGQVQVSLQCGNDTWQGHGNGLLSAALAAIAPNSTVRIEQFDEFSLSQDTQAAAMACVLVVDGERSSIATAMAQDSSKASLQALLNAVARLRAQ